MTVKHFVLFFFLFSPVAVCVDAALAEDDSPQAPVQLLAQASTGAAEFVSDRTESGGSDEGGPDVPPEGHKKHETERPGVRGGVSKGTFTDSDGTGWNYCSGKCTKRTETIPRAGGGKDKVIRIRNVNCTCSCVLFKHAGEKLDKKIEVTEDSGYFNIGSDQPSDYSLRCCEED